MEIVRAQHSSQIRLAMAAAVTIFVLLGVAPPARAATEFALATPYPAVAVAPGATVTFAVDVTTPVPERVALTLSGVPAGWTATMHGGNLLVDAVQTNGTDPVPVRIDVIVPTTATGTTTILLTGTAGAETRQLALQIRVEASAGGDVSLTTDFPSLKGPGSQTFNFNLTLTNKSAEDLTFAVNAQGPDGWTVNAQLTGQAQAASAVVKAGSTSGITVSAKPPEGIAAGSYPIQVVATAGSQQIPGTLEVAVTGSYTLSLSTPTQRLNANGAAGQNTDIALVVTNTGTAALTNVKLDATPPSGWKVTYDPAAIPSIDPGATQDITAHVVPSGDVVAGDYVITFEAVGDVSATSRIDIRFTVETSLQWAAVGIALIALVVVGVWVVFRVYGRR